MNCVILTTRTKHHIYFVNKISRNIQTTVILEHKKFNYHKLYWKNILIRKSVWALIDNPYLQFRCHKFQYLENEFEEKFFANGVSNEFNTRIYEFYSINDAECIELLSHLKPDIIISFGVGLIRKDILNLDALKINVHRGILPKYRGLDSDLWAFYFRDFENVGTTIHKLEPTFDTGDILAQTKLKILATMKVYQMRYYTTLMATEMVKGIIHDLEHGEEIRVIPQDLAVGKDHSYIPVLKRYLAIRRFNDYIKSIS